MREGFCIFENVLESEMVAKLNAMSEWTIVQEDPAHFEQHRAQGCIIPYWRYPHLETETHLATRARDVSSPGVKREIDRT